NIGSWRVPIRRVASLYLPNLSTDRIRRGSRRNNPPLSGAQGRGTARSAVEGRGSELAPPPAFGWSPSPANAGEDQEGERIADCSCPRGGHWRPGARWARELGQSRPARRPGVAPAVAPLVTVHKIGNKLEIAAACPAARALGFRPGMALATARALFAALDVRDSDPQGDAAFLTRLAIFAARRWTPRAALSGPDGLWLDLNGVAHLFGGERRMCERVLLFCARLGFEARIAVAGT